MVPDWKFASRIAILAITVPVTALLAYLLFFKNDEEEDWDQKVETSRQTTIRLAVPNKVVGAIIGQQGAVIKKIQEESGAKVHFMDREQQSTGNEDRDILIRGTTVSAQKAEVMILKIIADMPKIVTEEIEVPGYCIGRIIGKGGERIREMTRISQCKILVDRAQDVRALHLPRTITITGQQDGVELAKTLLAERVEEEEAARVKMAVGTANRGQRKQERRPNENGNEKSERSVTATLASRVVDENEMMWGAGDARAVKIATANPVKEFMEIFVSACEHPGHFWVQMVSSASLQLDRLTDEMTAFYSNSSTEEFQVKDVKAGDVVAAPFSDNLWYRAEVVGLQGDQADLYFMDYGDSLFLPIASLRELRPQYLSLPVQSVECKLANVRPTDEQWSEEAITCFERLTHCAAWKVLSARTVGYEKNKFGQVPCLEIFQPASDDQETDVAAELVARGFAVWDKKLPSVNGDSHPKPAPVRREPVRSDPVP